jgi:thiol-disulfide isomerase/thioredoxin
VRLEDDMTRLVCLMTAALWACDGEPAPTAPPAPAPVAQPAPARSAPPAKPAPRDVVGTEVDHLPVKKWLQGEEAVGDGPTLLVFWEVWCGYCRREVPKLQALHTEDNGVEVVGLTRMTKGVHEDKVVEFIEAQGVSYPIGVSTGELARALEVRGIPAAALVKDGIVVWRGHPGELSDEALQQLL